MTKHINFKVSSQKIKIFFSLTSSNIVQLLIQIASVPIFLKFFSHQEYATWLIALSLSQFSSLLDLGTLTASQNSFQVMGLQNRSKEIQSRVLQLNFILAATFVIYSIACLLYTINGNLNVSFSLVAILLLSNYLQAIVGIYEGLTRVQRLFSKGILTSNALRFFEFLGLMLGILLFSPNLISAALTSLAIKLLLFSLVVIKSSPNVKFFTIGRFKLHDLKNVLIEGFPFLLSKLADWLFVSGTLIVLATHFQPSMIIFFALLRTFFRQSIQISILVGSTYAYSSADAWARKDITRLKTIARKLFKIQLLIIVLFVLLYLFIGNFCFSKWTGGAFVLNPKYLLIGILYSSLLVMNQSIRNFFNSINSNRILSRITLIFSIFQLIFLGSSSMVNNPESAFKVLVIIEFFLIGVTFFIIPGTTEKHLNKT